MQKLLIIIALIFTTINISLAQEPIFKDKAWYDGIYMGAGMNKVVGDIKIGQIKRYAFTTEMDIKFNPNIFLGYGFNNYFATELLYSHGLRNRNTLIRADGDLGNLGDKYYEYNKYQLNVVGKYPISNFTPFIKLGIGYSKYKLSHIYKFNMLFNEGYKFQFRGFSYHLALGSELNFTSNHALIFVYDFSTLQKPVYNSKGINIDYDNSKITEQSIGIAYKYTFTS